LQGHGIDAQFGIELPRRDFMFAVVFLPKGRAYAQFTVALAAQLLRPGGVIWLVGDNKAGIKSHAKTLQPLGHVRKLDSARHCTLFAVHVQTSPTVDWRESLYTSPLSLGGRSLTMAHLPGVFNAGNLDAGTALLLAHLPAASPRFVLDLACGCGIIGAAAKQHWPNAVVRLSDHHALALAACRETLRINGLEAEVIAADVYTEIPGRFDLILSNPPFHQGIKTDYAAAECLVREAPNHLNPGGMLQIVANRFLPYRQWLTECFGACDTLADDTRFRVYRTTMHAG